MGENTKYFLRHLPVVGVFVIAAAAAAGLYMAAVNYTTYSAAVKVYAIGWFAACVLSFYCGLLVVPRSLGIIFSFAGIVAFAIVCVMDAGMLNRNPFLGRVIQALPALFFIAAWAAIAVSSCKSENKKIRLFSWLWLMIFVLLLAGWGSFHFARQKLLKQRNDYLVDAREKTLALAAQLDAYKQTHGVYPKTLEEAGVAPSQTRLTLGEERIRYSCHGDSCNLTFIDPLPCGLATVFSYDTAQEDRWFGPDPDQALQEKPCHIFLGYLRHR